MRRCEALSQGYYREFSPADDLREAVACTWVNVVQRGNFGERTPILPDGCTDIMLYDDAPPRVAGPDARVRWAALPAGVVIAGIRLRPGAARAVFHCSARGLLDQQPWLSDLAHVPARFLDALKFAGTLQLRHALLEDWVRTALRVLSVHDRMVLSACRSLSNDAHLEVGSLAEQLGWNARMIHRQFVASCGYGPKHLQRVMRVQAAIRTASRGAPFHRLPQVAGAAGFTDQAHMTREFRDLTGFTPAKYFAAYSPEVGAWLNSELG